MAMSNLLARLHSRTRRELQRPFLQVEGNVWVKHDAAKGGDDKSDSFKSRLCLYEDENKLTAAHQPFLSMVLAGAGRYSHWLNSVFFTTSDGSNPNTNGRRYSFDSSLDLESWEQERLRRSATHWQRHDSADVFLARGGREIPPPLIANLGLTNKCNLRCEICGSQKYLDRTGVRRRHMDHGTFLAVAETLFPVLAQVELNSQGDPLLYPRVEDVLATIEKHRCEAKIQHNGTLLTSSMIDRLLQLHGTIMLSLDAVGDKFDEVRSGGVWSKAQPGILQLLRSRDPRRLSIGVYPTLTERTIGEAINLMEWSAENNVDHITFHRYSPVQDSWERAPTQAEYQRVSDDLRRWCSDNGDPLKVEFEGVELNSGVVTRRRTEYADPEKFAWLVESGKVMFPAHTGAPGSDPFSVCAAPFEYVEIGLGGKISACCRSQDVALGDATSVDAFCESWFGRNYFHVRQSLRRGAVTPYPLPNCAPCVQFFAPKEARHRVAVDYSIVRNLMREHDEIRLKVASEDVLPIEVIQKEEGFCHIATFPLGITEGRYELWEDEAPLARRNALHQDIRAEGQGRHNIGPNVLYFSTSDGSDARRNGRKYTLRSIRTVAERAGFSTKDTSATRAGGAKTQRALSAARAVSMLGEAALAQLNEVASVLDTPVIEIGPYIGGSTIALASGARAGVVTVELGGPNPGHPTIPSANIVRDLRANLAKHGLLERVTIIEGHFRAEASVDSVRTALRGAKSRMLFVDVHPGTEIAVGIYSQFVAPDAFIVIDDYDSDIAVEKAASVRSYVDRAVAEGVVTSFGVFGWGTWFGRLTGERAAERLASIPALLPCVHESGHAWHVFVGHQALSDDVLHNESPLVLFEDGAQLGPAHCLHQEIRELGCGRFSHWGGYLWFSSSDNTDPRHNGREYSIKVHDRVTRVSSPEIVL